MAEIQLYGRQVMVSFIPYSRVPAGPHNASDYFAVSVVQYCVKDGVMVSRCRAFVTALWCRWLVGHDRALIVRPLGGNAAQSMAPAYR